MRFLGIDFGEKRIGLAISDPAGRLALPLTTLERRNDRSALRQIAEIAQREGVERLVLGVPAALAACSWWTLQRPYKGYEGTEARVLIPPGTGTGRILQILQRDGVIADARLARVYMIYKGEPKLQAGEYAFRGELTTAQVLGKLARGQTVGRTLTIIEGLTLEEIADQLAHQGFGRREVFLDLMRSPRLIADLDPDAPDLEGYLFPETYSFAVGAGEK